MKAHILIVLSLNAFLSLSCQKSPTGPQNHQAIISVKGHFPAAPVAKSAVAGKSSKAALDPSLVASVAAYFGMGGFMISKVNDGGFELVVPRTEPAALLFIDSAGKSLGYLSLDGGMESIPLNKAEDSVTSIDLQTLTSAGAIIEPGHNPIGTEILMTAGDIASFIFSNGTLGSIVKSPDVDGNGIVDVAEGVSYGYHMRYDINGGTFGTGQTPTIANPIVINSYSLEIKVSGSDVDFPDTIFFNGPAGSGIESAQSWMKQGFGANGRIDGYSYCAPPIQNPSIPPAGTYLVAFNGKTLTFTLPSQVEITRYLAIPIPTAVLNTDGTIHKLTWEYRLSDGSGRVDPQALIMNLNLQVYASMGSGQPVTQIYNTPNLPPDITEHVLSNQSIPWSGVNCIATWCVDVFGNQFLIKWDRP